MALGATVLLYFCGAGLGRAWTGKSRGHAYLGNIMSDSWGLRGVASAGVSVSLSVHGHGRFPRGRGACRGQGPGPIGPPPAAPGALQWDVLTVDARLVGTEGVEAELRKSGDASHFATDGSAPRRYDGYTTAARVRVAVLAESQSDHPLVGDGVPRLRRAR